MAAPVNPNVGHKAIYRGNRMTKLRKLQDLTEQFFSLHWYQDKLGEPPAWQVTESYFSGPVPNHDRGGCYALLNEADIEYLGLGISNRWNPTHDHGISIRLSGHVIRSKPGARGQYIPRESWKHITHIATIGFSKEHNYIAAALECFLIRELSPPGNRRK